MMVAHLDLLNQAGGDALGQRCLPCSSPAQRPAELLLAALPSWGTHMLLPSLALGCFPCHECRRGGGIRVGDLCLAQCSASLCEQRETGNPATAGSARCAP